MSETYLGARPAAIRHHYDVGNEFWRIWLDPTMSYSCAMWEDPDDDLERAQRRKLDFHVDQARAAGAARVLDVGCGWGAMLMHLVGSHGVKHAVGLTLSDAQAEYLRAIAPGNVEVLVRSWSDYEPTEPFDAIISVGAFEHFARQGLSPEEQIEAYRRFFRSCRSGSSPAGGYRCRPSRTVTSRVIDHCAIASSSTRSSRVRAATARRHCAAPQRWNSRSKR